MQTKPPTKNNPDPPKTLVWINSNFDSISLMIVYIISLIPFITNGLQTSFYLILGIGSGGLSMYYIKMYAKELEREIKENKAPGRTPEKESNLYAYLGSGIMILGVLGMMMVITDDDKSLADMPLYKFFYSFAGGLLGMIFGGLLFNPLKPIN